MRGVIAAEMPSSWAAEALKVQAVAARTYAITDDVGGDGFDLYTDTRSQMYRGVAAETPATDAAVAATARAGGHLQRRPRVTYFSASSGGYTENIENVWAGAAARAVARGVPDPYDGAGGNPNYHWGYQLTTAAAGARLGALLKGQLVGIQVTKHGVSPRIIRARVIGTGGGHEVTGSQLQRPFGLDHAPGSRSPPSRRCPGLRPDTRGRWRRRWRRRPWRSGALVPLVRAMVAGPAPAVHGSVFPAAQGAMRSPCRCSGARWQTVRKLRVGSRRRATRRSCPLRAPTGSVVSTGWTVQPSASA